MAGKFARSWSLMKSSAAVLRSDKSLMMFPLLSGLCCLLVAASFLIPIGMAMMGAERAGVGERGLSVGAYAALFVFYLVQYFVIIFLIPRWPARRCSGCVASLPVLRRGSRWRSRAWSASSATR